MVNDNQYSNLIYEYFLVRFHSLYYKYGNTLPSIDILCREFNVSAQTVKAALRRLRAEGYISMHNGTVTTVTFQQTRQGAVDFILNYFSERWADYYDLYSSAELVFIPMLVEGLKRMDEEDLALLSHLEERAEADDLVHFYCCVLQKIENPLALNLFWETTLYQGFPFARLEPQPIHFDTGLVRRRLKVLMSRVYDKDWKGVQAALLEYQQSDIHAIQKALGPYIRPLPKESQIPFVWRVYHNRPQICYNLASQILHDIYLGEFREVQYLPSYEKLAEKYGVSVSTLRRTIAMLSQAGACRTINVKGFLLYTSCRHLCGLSRWGEAHVPACRRVGREAVGLALQSIVNQRGAEAEVGSGGSFLLRILRGKASLSRLHLIDKEGDGQCVGEAACRGGAYLDYVGSLCQFLWYGYMERHFCSGLAVLYMDAAYLVITALEVSLPAVGHGGHFNICIQTGAGVIIQCDRDI